MLICYPIKNAAGITISQMSTKGGDYYFVATIRGWKGFYLPTKDANEAYTMAKEIRSRIEANDESVFQDTRYNRTI
jgi:hypothetical protein